MSGVVWFGSALVGNFQGDLACVDYSCADWIAFRPWLPIQESVHMLKKICSWIVAIVVFICVIPFLAYAVSLHSDFGIPWQKYLKENNCYTGHH